jgi:nucleoredoxin
MNEKEKDVIKSCCSSGGDGKECCSLGKFVYPPILIIMAILVGYRIFSGGTCPFSPSAATTEKPNKITATENTAQTITAAQKTKGSSLTQKYFPAGLIDASGKTVSGNFGNKLLGIYFSAGWCPPCRAFTPELVKFRNSNKDEFEVVLVSADKSLQSQLDYMKNKQMPWPAVKFDSPDTEKLSRMFGVRGIPFLVIIDAKGNIVSTNGVQEVYDNQGQQTINIWKNKGTKK